MKLRSGYLLRSVAGKNIVVSIGNNVDFTGMLTLNDTGVFYWNMLKDGTTKEKMLDAITKEYDVSKEDALADLEEFILKLTEAKLLED